MTEETVRAEPPTAGAMLRAAREQRGMHIGVLAASIKVAQRKLEALEADRYDELPDISFTRALALTVCRALKLDPEPVLARLPQIASQQPGLERVAGGLQTPFRERPGREPADWSWMRRPVFWGTALVLVAAAALALLPDHVWQGFDRPAEPVVVPLPADTAPAPDAAASPPAEAAAPPAVDPAPAVAAEPAPATAQGPTAVLRARAESWVEVQDASGRTLLARTLQAGETVSVDGAPPLRAKIGNAPATELVFRNQRIDLAPATGRDNVARLELK